MIELVRDRDDDVPAGDGQGQTDRAREVTLTEFIIGEQRRQPVVSAELIALVNDIRLACKRIATIVGKGGLSDAVGKSGTG